MKRVISFDPDGHSKETDNICPRCNKPVLNQERGKAIIDGEMAHVKCAMDEMDELGMDDFTNDWG